MGVEEMYEDFRNQYPELAKAADVRHTEIWGSVDRETAFSWFESLAGAVNAKMGIPDQGNAIASIFKFFDAKFRNGSNEVKNCIDVSFVENLFWEVNPRSATPVWAALPKALQQLYINFHGQPPTLV